MPVAAPARPFLPGALALLLLLAGCGQPASWDPLGDVVRHGMAVELNATDPPASYLQTGDAASVRQSMLDRAKTELGRYDADPALRQEVAISQNEILQTLANKGGGRVGGVASVELSQVQMTEETARATARITVWSKSAQFWWQDPRSFESASNVLGGKLSFVRRDGVWKINQQAWRFAPGGGP